MDLYQINWFTITLRLSLAAVIGGIIGYERGSHNHPAGLRTHMLICMGSALAMITNQFVRDAFNPTADLTRLGAQVISGISFLGAGTIIIGKNKVRGLTTAAGVWVSACIGLAAGIGFYEGAIAGGIIALVIIILVARIHDRSFNRVKILSLYIECENMEKFYAMLEQLKEKKLNVVSVDIVKVSLEKVNSAIILKLKKVDNYFEIMSAIATIPGILSTQRV